MTSRTFKANLQKVKALVANPKVALTIDTAEPPWHILLVRGTASVEIVDGVVLVFSSR